MIPKKNTAQVAIWTANRSVDLNIQPLAPNSNRAAVITSCLYKVNGYTTRLLQLRPETFKIGRHGLLHVSGMYFPLDHENFQLARDFLQGVI